MEFQYQGLKPALSYTWGSPGDTHHVSLNGQRVPIRQNLYDALNQISSTRLVNRYLWVNAVCINQGENVEALDERSIQITLMKQIYEQASDDVRYSITPDYANKTVLGVYTDVARYCLLQTGHGLDFLGYTMCQEQQQSAETPQGIRSTLPSWVPNFSASLDLYPIPKVLFPPAQPRRKGVRLVDKHGFLITDETQIPAYHPLGDIEAESSIKNATLFVRGAYVDMLKDKIINIGPFLETVRPNAREAGARWVAAPNDLYFTGERYIGAYMRSMVLDVVYDSEGWPLERGNAYDGDLMLEPQAELTPTEYIHQASMSIAQNNACSLREMGLGQKHYLFAIPHTAVVGDTIWALAGGQVLYVLNQ